MKVRVGHWNGASLEKLENQFEVKYDDPDRKNYCTIEVDQIDLEGFCDCYGPIQVFPPGFGTCKDEWFIWITRDNFKQC